MKKVQIIDIILEENSHVKATGMIKIKSKALREQIQAEGFKKMRNNKIKKFVISEFSKDLKCQLCKYDIKSYSRHRLLEVLKRAKIVGEDDEILKVYHDALAVSEAGYRIVLKRDVDELFVNNYNPEWILNWDANIDIQLCLDFYAVITYIREGFKH